jgi:hypothetical protein
MRQIPEEWNTAAGAMTERATERSKAVAEALTAKEANIARLEGELKAAKKDKDFAKTGALEGEIKSDEMVIKVLKGLKAQADSMTKFAAAWQAAGKSIDDFIKTDDAFDAVREKGIARPEAGQPDTRLTPADVEIFKKHVAAMDQMGKAFSQFGSAMNAVASQRDSLIKAMEKGGNIQTAPK